MIWNIATYTEGDSDRGAHETHVQGKNTGTKRISGGVVFAVENNYW